MFLHEGTFVKFGVRVLKKPNTWCCKRDDLEDRADDAVGRSELALLSRHCWRILSARRRSPNDIKVARRELSTVIPSGNISCDGRIEFAVDVKCDNLCIRKSVTHSVLPML